MCVCVYLSFYSCENQFWFNIIVEDISTLCENFNQSSQIQRAVCVLVLGLELGLDLGVRHLVRE